MKYIANPVEVDAFEILSVSKEGQVGGSLALKLDTGNIVVADTPMMARYKPQPGDYWVRQADGYVYLNPKDVFERKYSPKPIVEAAPE